MSAVLRAVITRYRRGPSPRPDGATHVRDDLGITHAVEAGENGGGFSSCGRQVSCYEEGMTTLAGLPGNGARILVPTWGEIDCMACVAARAT